MPLAFVGMFLLSFGNLIHSANAQAASPGTKVAAVGYDLSWPQCGRTFPPNRRFAVVGINGGTPNTTNPCLQSQLRWAAHLPAVPGRPQIDLYVNTANPGRARARDWPGSNRASDLPGAPGNPYGVCRGRDNPACAWEYGWMKARFDVGHRGPRTASQFHWWLDVEIGNEWEPNRLNNRAVLAAMASYFRFRGIPIGLYTTAYQWSVIAGVVNAKSPLAHLPEWLAGASTLAQAQRSCRLKPVMPNGTIVLAQWYTRGALIDSDYSCPAPTPRRREPVSR